MRVARRRFGRFSLIVLGEVSARASTAFSLGEVSGVLVLIVGGPGVWWS